ncbi:MAG: redoxin domain-containing protein [Myxococcales bacterium]|nr:redoxin domain-containing protein [Myxococcales bacterium]
MFAFLPAVLFGCPAPVDEGMSPDDDDVAIDPAGDEDGDGLTNGEEVELGTEYDEADSDGDGFDDGVEVEAGTNPNFEWSHTFEKGDYIVGDCPVIPDEANAGPTGTGSTGDDAYQEGDIAANFDVGGTDMHGQETTLYSFCGNYVLITMSAEWCGPCQAMAATLAEEQETVRKKVPNFTMFESLTQDNYGEVPAESVLKRWSKSYDLEGIPVVAPEDNTTDDVTYWLIPDGGIPAGTLLAPDMTVIWSGVDHPGEYNPSGALGIKNAIRDYEDSL